MPFAGYDDFDDCVSENSDKRDPEAYCAVIKREVEGESNMSKHEQDLADSVEMADGTVKRHLQEFGVGDQVVWDWQGSTVHGIVESVNPEQATVDGVTITGDDDEPVYVIDEYDDQREGYQSDNVAKPESSLDESTKDLPPHTDENMLSAPRQTNPMVMQLTNVRTEPIKRDQTDRNTVRYSNLSLLTEGVWTDQKSRTPTLYPDNGIDNIKAQFSEDYQGPPVNVMHDVSPVDGDVNQASLAGYVDPSSLEYSESENTLMGDVVLDLGKAAGEFADENMQSALASNGEVGFGGPSVELDLAQRHIRNSEHPQAEKEITGGYLTGLGLVMDPADDNVAFKNETQERPVAMADGQRDKTLMTQKTLMNKEEIRETLDRFGIDVGEMTDDEMMDMASELHDELMENLTEDDNMSYHGDYNDDDEDDDDAMMENMERVESLESEMESMRAQMEEMRDMMMEEMDNMDSDMMDMESQMASLRDEKKALEKRLRQIEDEPQEPETYSESNDFAEWVDADGHISDSPNSLR